MKAPTTPRKTETIVMDGPFAETKEQLLGFYVIDVENVDVANQISVASHPGMHVAEQSRCDAEPAFEGVRKTRCGI